MFSFGKSPAPSAHDHEIKELIHSKWGDFDEVVRQEVGHLEAKYLKWRRHSKIAGGFLIGGIIVLAGDDDGSMLGLLHDLFGLSWWFTLIIALLAITAIGFSGWILWQWAKVKREFNKVFNPLVFEKAFAVLGYEADHATKESITQKEVVDLLDHSELITENRNRYQIDDMVVAEYDGRKLFMAELNVKYVTGSGKSRRVKKIFHGVFVSHDLPRTLSGKTFITTEGDKRGFGHNSWWRRLFKRDDTPRETLLEWNEFEDKLHVATTDESEARYILTTDLMANLYDWWTTRKGKIRLVFLDNRLYVLYPDKSIRIGSSTVSLKRVDLEEYILTVARPMWHVQKLLEQADARLKSW